MSRERPIGFLHRVNEYGLLESACPACFEVISRQADETALLADEMRHRCEEMILQESLEYFRSQPVPANRAARRGRQ